MKTLEEKQAELSMHEKEKAIQCIDVALRKHIVNRYDINDFIVFLSGSSEFISGFQDRRHDLVFKLEMIERIIREHGNEEDINLFKGISNTFISGMILSGHLKEGTDLINKMHDDLQAILIN